jgi:fucose 4-O-acetylase-like acetyltransferase
MHFLALALVVSHVTRPDWRGLMKPAVKAMIRCGENSLEVYCLSVLLSFLASVILTNSSGSFAMHAATATAGIAIIIAAATATTWMNKQDRRGPKPF